MMCGIWFFPFFVCVCLCFCDVLKLFESFFYLYLFNSFFFFWLNILSELAMNIFLVIVNNRHEMYVRFLLLFWRHTFAWVNGSCPCQSLKCAELPIIQMFYFVLFLFSLYISNIYLISILTNIKCSKSLMW